MSLRNHLRLLLSCVLGLEMFAAQESDVAALEIKKSTLSNGSILLVSEQHQLPMVTAMIALDAGARHDPQGKAGLAVLTARCLSQGTKQLSAVEFNQKVDFM